MGFFKRKAKKLKSDAIILSETEAVSGGNFHGQVLAMAIA